MSTPIRPRVTSLATNQAPPLDLPFRFMATGLGWLLLLALVYPLHVPLLLGSFYDPHLITFVHVNTLGVIAAIIFGASYQLLPVVLQSAIASVRLGRISWWLYLPGLILFVLGLSQGWTLALGLGGTLIFSSVGLYVGVVIASLARAPKLHRDVVFWHIAVAAVTLAVGASLGILLALSKVFGFLHGLTLPTLAAHATLMVGGWVAPMIAGVAYRLVGMFTLSEDELLPGLAWAGLISLAGGAWTLALGLLLQFGPLPNLLGSSAIAVGIVLFAAQLVRLYRRRRRRTFDVHIPFALTAVIFGVLAAALLVFGLATERPVSDPIWISVGWLGIAGLGETAIQGFFYKIGTFLTWLNRYAPVAGRRPVPKLEELYGRQLALVGWALWTLGVGTTALAVVLGVAWIVLPASLALSLGAAAFLINVGRIALHWRRQPVGETGRRPVPSTRSGAESTGG